MKKFLLGLLVFVVIVGALAGSGFVGYRIGLRQGVAIAANGNAKNPPVARGNDFGFNRIPNFRNGIMPGLRPGFGPRGFGMMPFGRGFGLFFGLRFLMQVAILGFIVWLIYKLMTGWRLSFTPPASHANNAPNSTPNSEARVMDVEPKPTEDPKPTADAGN